MTDATEALARALLEVVTNFYSAYVNHDGSTWSTDEALGDVNAYARPRMEAALAALGYEVRPICTTCTALHSVRSASGMPIHQAAEAHRACLDCGADVDHRLDREWHRLGNADHAWRPIEQAAEAADREAAGESSEQAEGPSAAVAKKKAAVEAWLGPLATTSAAADPPCDCGVPWLHPADLPAAVAPLDPCCERPCGKCGEASGLGLCTGCRAGCYCQRKRPAAAKEAGEVSPRRTPRQFPIGTEGGQTWESIAADGLIMRDPPAVLLRDTDEDRERLVLALHKRNDEGVCWGDHLPVSIRRPNGAATDCESDADAIIAALREPRRYPESGEER